MTNYINIYNNENYINSLVSAFNNYKKCNEYCNTIINSPDEKNNCINNIIKKLKNKRGNSIKVCNTCNNDCPVMHKEGYKKLLLLLIKLVNFIYYVRFLISNNIIPTNYYDNILISSISKIKLHKFDITLDELNCIKYSTTRLGFPKTLGDYIKIFLTKNSNTRNNVFLSKYNNFLSDFQPWLRSLVDFLNKNAKDIIFEYYQIDEIPDPTKPRKYLNFLKNIHAYKYIDFKKNIYNETNLTSINKFQKKLIKYLFKTL